MMPRIYKVILVGKGHIEDYEIPVEVSFNSKIMTIEEHEKHKNFRLEEWEDKLKERMKNK